MDSLVNLIDEHLTAIFETSKGLEFNLNQYFSKHVRQIGFPILTQINWIFTNLWYKLNLAENLITFFTKVFEWVAIFLNAFVFAYKQFIFYLYFICKALILAIYNLLKWFFEFDFIETCRVLLKWFCLKYNSIYHLILIVHNIVLAIFVNIFIKIYSLFSFLSGYTEKIYVPEVYHKLQSFWLLSEHDYFGYVPIATKHFDNIYNSLIYSYPTTREKTVVDIVGAKPWESKAEIQQFLYSIVKSYEKIFEKTYLSPKTWILGVYGIFFSIVHLFFKMIALFIDLVFTILGTICWTLQII